MTDDDEVFSVRFGAAAALSQLLFKDSSVEVAVRSVLRIADHRGLTWWKLWATLQLETLRTETLGEQIAEVLDADFPEVKASQRELTVQQALDEYNYLRSSSHSFSRSTAALAVMEKETALTEMAYARDPDGLDGARQMVLARTEILSRIRSRVQYFLSTVERGESPTTPPPRAIAAGRGPIRIAGD